jgi:hypothetical protein
MTDAEWMPLVGSIEVEVHEVRELSIHGDPYVDLLVSPPGAATAAAVRTMRSLLPRVPARGDRVRLHLLMRQVDRVELV